MSSPSSSSSSSLSVNVSRSPYSWLFAGVGAGLLLSRVLSRVFPSKKHSSAHITPRYEYTDDSLTSTQSQQVYEFQNYFMEHLTSAMTLSSIQIGYKVGLWNEIAKHDTPVTSAALATALDLNERMVREWLYTQASAGFIQMERIPAEQQQQQQQHQTSSSTTHAFQFSLTLAQKLVLCPDQENTRYFVGALSAFPFANPHIRSQVADVIRTGNGFSYDQHGTEFAAALATWARPFVTYELPLRLAKDAEISTLLTQDNAKVLDVGCGKGYLMMGLAERFPKAQFHGYDTSTNAITLAREELKKRGLKNVTFHLVGDNEEKIPQDHSFSLAINTDSIHDMRDPSALLSQLYAALSPQGLWLSFEPKCTDDVEETVKLKNAKLLLNCSLHVCLPSALSTPSTQENANGPDLGGIGYRPSVAKQLCQQAGFTRFKVREAGADFGAHFMNCYEVRI